MALNVQQIRNLSGRQLLGWVLIVLSCLAWVGLPIVPFLPVSLATKGAWTAGLLIFAEVAWWSAMPLLGPEIVAGLRKSWATAKAWFKRLFSRR